MDGHLSTIPLIEAELSGFMDLVCVHRDPGLPLMVELKTDTGQLTLAQRRGHGPGGVYGGRGGMLESFSALMNVNGFGR